MVDGNCFFCCRKWNPAWRVNVIGVPLIRCCNTSGTRPATVAVIETLQLRRNPLLGVPSDWTIQHSSRINTLPTCHLPYPVIKAFIRAMIPSPAVHKLRKDCCIIYLHFTGSLLRHRACSCSKLTYVCIYLLHVTWTIKAAAPIVHFDKAFDSIETSERTNCVSLWTLCWFE